MHELDDMALLREFAAHDSEPAFAELVTRHVNKVYSVALRHTRNPHSAEEITQAVFVILARKAGTLGKNVILSGWLYQTARLTAVTLIRSEIRRARREQEVLMQTNESAADPWPHIAPLLDDAMDRLSETDRHAVVLRYFDGKSLKEVGAALGGSEDAAKMRVNRAVEKLRTFFAKRGVTLTATVIASALAANSIQAAPVGLVTTVVTAAMKGATVAISTASLVQGTLKTLAWAKYKTLINLGIVATITGGALVVTAVLHEQPPKLIISVSKPVEAVREVMTDTAFISLDSPPGGLAVQADGKIVIAASLFGNFIDPQSGRLGYFERGAIRLNADGSLDRSFYCRAEFPGNDSSRAHVDLLQDGKLLMSGLFDSVNGKPRPGYARLLSDGSVDESFVPMTNPANSNAPALGRTYLPGGTYPAAALSDGSVAVMTQNPLTVYRLDPTGKLILTATNDPTSVFPPYAGLIWTLQGAGFWGNWWGHKPVDWNRTAPASRRPLVKPNEQLPFEDCAEQPSATDAAAVFKSLFAEVPFELCRVAVRLPDGGAILGIQDEFINGSLTAPGRLMRFDKNWRPDFSFTNQYETDRRGGITIKRLKDGKFLVAGGFGKMNGEDFPGLIRLNEDGQIDHSFHCEVTAMRYGRLVMDIAVQEDGRIVICGPFTTVNGVKCQHIARLNPDGSLDTTFKNPFISLEELQTHRHFPVCHLTAKSAPAATNVIAPSAVALPAETIVITAMNYQGGVAMIQFTGNPNKQYILQAKDSLDAADWNNISTNQSDASGNGNFRDPAAKNYPTRFYRIATP